MSNNEVFYFSDPNGMGGASGAAGGPGVNGSARLVGVPSTGGAAVLRLDLPTESTLGSVAADTTGVYWSYNARNDPAGFGGADGGNTAAASSIRKFSFGTGDAADFAPATVIDPGELLTDGSRVVWSDAQFPGPTTIRSRNSDGSQALVLGSAALVRGLASDGTFAYWAASSAGDDYSDILAAPLAGGPVQTVSCHVSSVYGLSADASGLYYFTYTADPVIAVLPARPHD